TFARLTHGVSRRCKRAEASFRTKLRARPAPSAATRATRRNWTTARAYGTIAARIHRGARGAGCLERDRSPPALRAARAIHPRAPAGVGSALIHPAQGR